MMAYKPCRELNHVKPSFYFPNMALLPGLFANYLLENFSRLYFIMQTQHNGTSETKMRYKGHCKIMRWVLRLTLPAYRKDRIPEDVTSNGETGISVGVRFCSAIRVDLLTLFSLFHPPPSFFPFRTEDAYLQRPGAQL